MTRVSALKELTKELTKPANNSFVVSFFNESKNELMSCVSYDSAQVRELAVDLINDLVSKFDLSSDFGLILGTILSRVDKLPFVETCYCLKSRRNKAKNSNYSLTAHFPKSK